MSIHEGLFLLDPAARWQVAGCGSQGGVCWERGCCAALPETSGSHLAGAALVGASRVTSLSVIFLPPYRGCQGLGQDFRGTANYYS